MGPQYRRIKQLKQLSLDIDGDVLVMTLCLEMSPSRVITVCGNLKAYVRGIICQSRLCQITQTGKYRSLANIIRTLHDFHAWAACSVQRGKFKGIIIITGIADHL